MAKLIKAGDFVGRGEERAAAYFEEKLPEPWVVVCNKELVDPNGTAREVDFIVIAGHSIFAIEEKSWSGPIHGDSDGWVLASGESFPSPIGTSGAIAKRLAGMLRSDIPFLKKQVVGHFVFARVVLSSDEVSLFVRDPRRAEEVLRLEGSEDDLERFDTLQKGEASIGVFRDKIITRLTQLRDRPKVPKQIQGWEIVESLPGIGLARCFRGRHPDGSERILRLLERPYTALADRREQEQVIRLREYESLKKLAPRGRVPQVDPWFYWDQDQFWVVPIHPIDGKTLRADRADAAPDPARIWKIGAEAFRALADVHEAGIVHRALTPDRIHIRKDGKVAFSDFVIARIGGAQTIAAQAAELMPEDSYRAPECRVDLGLAEASSDVFGLALSVLYWITGQEPSEDGQPASILEAATEILGEKGKDLTAILGRCIGVDERGRSSAAEVAEKVAEIDSRNRDEVEQSPSRSTTASAPSFTPGDLIEEQYRIIRILGEGATATTYLAEDVLADSLFVLKRIRNPELASRLARAEFRILRDLRHPGLPMVYDIRPPGSPFHLKLEYICGSSLGELSQQYSGNLDFCIRLGAELLEVLAYLADRNLIHRDIAPGNILIPDESQGHIRLIDFGLAAIASDRSSSVGTPRYRAPEIERGGSWSPASDQYSVGTVLFELLTGRLPYEVTNDVGRKDKQVKPSEEETKLFGHRLLDTLLRATAPDPGTRFPSAAGFAEALKNCAFPELESTGSGQEVVNPFVDELRSAYRNSRIGNAGNRGLDSKFATETYVPTRLDTVLLPELVAGRYRLIILSGNPGDGKTAFLQRVKEELLRVGGGVESEDASGWRLRVGERRFVALYDASESHEGRGADELLSEVLWPLSGSAPTADDYTAAIAINDGRLLDFFERNGALRFPWLWQLLRSQLFDGSSEDSTVVLVDLKRRSIVGGHADEKALFSGVLSLFTGRGHWEACEGCVARHECPVRLNAMSFRDPVSGPQIRVNLHGLLLAVHLGRERRPTIRDLRSALAFLITHDLACAEIHEERRSGRSPLAGAARLYFNASFSGEGSPDLLLDEWAQLDPAVVPSPRLDRFLHFHRGREDAPRLRRIFVDVEGRADCVALAAGAPDRGWLVLNKRRYYFESALPGEDELPIAKELLPYRHASRFVEAVSGREDEGTVLGTLVEGISRADGVPAEACKGSLALRITEGIDEEVAVVKRFPRSEFRLRRVGGGSRFTETVADQLLLEHRDGAPSLGIGLDLFEFICRAAEGFLPGVEEQAALLEDLGTFKNQLLARPTERVVIVEGGRRIHHVRLEDGKIRREKASA